MLADYLETFIRLLYPAQCALCRTPLALRETILCRHCNKELDCLACSPDSAYLEGPHEHLDHVWATYKYSSPLRELLHAIKYHRKDYLFRIFQHPVHRLAQAIGIEIPYDSIIPVPLYRSKRLERQFNQAELLCGLLAPCFRAQIQGKLLKKKYRVPPQALMSREERMINIYGAFKIPVSHKVRGKTVLLVDDVFTTGATSNEAARILKKAGAKRVDLFALASPLVSQSKGCLSPCPNVFKARMQK